MNISKFCICFFSIIFSVPICAEDNNKIVYCPSSASIKAEWENIGNRIRHRFVAVNDTNKYFYSTYYDDGGIWSDPAYYFIGSEFYPNFSYYADNKLVCNYAIEKYSDVSQRYIETIQAELINTGDY